MSTGIDRQRGNIQTGQAVIHQDPVVAVVGGAINSPSWRAGEDVPAGIDYQCDDTLKFQAVVYSGPTVTVVSRSKNSTTPCSCKNMIGGIDRQSAHVRVCQAIVDSGPGLTVIGGAKYATSLGTDEDVTTRICGERNAITALRTISLDPKVWTGPRNTSFTALLLRNVPS